MHMPGLGRLHAGMRAVGIDRARFPIPYNHLAFDGVFLADGQPYELGLACKGHNFVLLFEVDRQYHVAAYVHDKAMLAALVAALRTDGTSGRRFSVSDFLAEIDKRLPRRITVHDRALPGDVARIRREVEEADKIHLCGWRPHPKDGSRKVTDHNLAKTRAWLGQVQHDWCKKHNVSTCWTDNPALAIGSLDRPNWPGYA